MLFRFESLLGDKAPAAKDIKWAERALEQSMVVMD